MASESKWETTATIIDRYRIIPRILVLAYCIWLGSTVTWFMGLEQIEVRTCDSDTLKVLLDKSVPVAAAEDIACTVTSLIGGPSNQHTTFMSVLTGIAPAIFAFYVNAGRRRPEDDGE